MSQDMHSDLEIDNFLARNNIPVIMQSNIRRRNREDNLSKRYLKLIHYRDEFSVPPYNISLVIALGGSM